MKNRDLEKEFEDKYNRYGSMLYRIAFLYLGNTADAEDVLQDVFTKYLFNRKKFNGIEHEKAWFIRSTQNKCLDFLKKSNRKNLSIDTVSATTENKSDLEHDVLKNIFALPEKYKTAVILYYYNGYSVEEIARILKASTSAVKKRLQRGREMLKFELEDYKD